jgi:hypothetical protein
MEEKKSCWRCYGYCSHILVPPGNRFRLVVVHGPSRNLVLIFTISQPTCRGGKLVSGTGTKKLIMHFGKSPPRIRQLVGIFTREIKKTLIILRCITRGLDSFHRHHRPHIPSSATGVVPQHPNGSPPGLNVQQNKTTFRHHSYSCSWTSQVANCRSCSPFISRHQTNCCRLRLCPLGHD